MGCILVFRIDAAGLPGRKPVHCGDCLFVLFNHLGRWIHQPYFAGAVDVFAGKECDGVVHGLLLAPKVEDVAVGLGVVEHTIGAREGLNQPVVPEVFVHVQGVEVLGVEAGEQHVHHDGDVDLVLMRQIAVGVLLVLDALLHVLIVAVELADDVAGVVPGVVVGNDFFQGGLFLLRVLPVVGPFLGQVFLQLPDILVAVGRGRENAGNVERRVIRVFGLALGLIRLEQPVVSDGVVDGGGGQQGIEAALAGGGLMLGENGVHHRPLGDGLIGLGRFGLGTGLLFGLRRVRRAFVLEVVDMKAQHVAVINGVGDGVGVQLLFKDILGGAVAAHGAVDLLVAGVFIKDGRAGKAEQLRPGGKGQDGLVVEIGRAHV